MNHDDTGRDDDIMDRDVETAYRSIATERAPGHLDKAILDDARRGAQTSRGPLLKWRRPLAWAATIALSFALLLEFTQQSPELLAPSALEDAEFSAESPAASSVSPADSDTAIAPDAVDRNLEESVMTTNMPQKAAEPVVQSEAAKRNRLEELETMSSPRASNGNLADQGVQAAAPAELRTEAFDQAATAASAAVQKQERYLMLDSTAARTRETAEPADELPCHGELRDDPETWRDCILDLVEAGRLEEARAESLLYREAYPDQPLPE